MNQHEPPQHPYRSTLIVAVSVIFAGIFDYFFLWNSLGIAVPIFVLLIGATVIGLNTAFHRSTPRDVYLLLALAVFFASLVALRANILLTALNIGATMLLLLMVTETNIRGKLTQFYPSDYLKIFGLPIMHIGSAFNALGSFRIPLPKHTDPKTKQVLRGAALTIPVLIVFVILLAGADPIFNSFVTWVSQINISFPENPYIIGLVAFIMCGAFAYSFRSNSVFQDRSESQRRPMGHIETAILLGSVNILFVTFILLQATYFFGGETNITASTYTYAEYARRGFFELIAIAACSYLILVMVERFIERNTERHSAQFKYLSSALITQVMILMVFAFSRLSLYESMYGFTTLRLYSHAFIIFLAVIYVFLLYKIFFDSRENLFALKVFYAIVTFVVAMNILNPDAFIARKNLERLASNERVDIDISYLTDLSSDATPTLLPAIESRDPRFAPVTRSLSYRIDSSLRPWQSWNLSERIEQDLLIHSPAVLESQKAAEKEAIDYTESHQSGE